jgi:tRNA G18 (ribose-2'-O)-methylase SpoU
VEYVKRGKMQIVRMESLEECVRHIKSMCCCDERRREMEEHNNKQSQDHPANTLNGTIPIIGIEIDPTSISLEHYPFSTSTAFMMGNEGQGMTKKQMAHCDGFVRINQYGGGTASLNVSVAVAVVLQRFCQR